MDDIWRGIQHVTFADASDFSVNHSRFGGGALSPPSLLYASLESSPRPQQSAALQYIFALGARCPTNLLACNPNAL
jgi:hypothetical protein